MILKTFSKRKNTIFDTHCKSNHELNRSKTNKFSMFVNKDALAKNGSVAIPQFLIFSVCALIKFPIAFKVKIKLSRIVSQIRYRKTAFF